MTTHGRNLGRSSFWRKRTISCIVRVPSLPLSRRKSARFARMMTFDGFLRSGAAAAAGAQVAGGGEAHGG